MKTKFWKTKNTATGFKILVSSVLASLVVLIPAWAIRWLIKVQNMFVLGIVLAIGLFFFYYHTLGYFYRRFFK